MAPVGPREAALVLGLVLVVELLQHPLAQLVRDRLGVEPGRERLREPQDHAGVREVGPDRRVDARVLDLHRHLAAVVQHAAVHLADRRGRERLRLDPLEQLLVGLVVLAARAPGAPSPRASAGAVRAKRRQLLLVQLAVLLGQVVGVDEGGELAHLHRGALHRAERLDQPLGRRQRGFVHPLAPLVLRAHGARGLGAGEPRALHPRPHRRASRSAPSRLLGMERSLGSSPTRDNLAMAGEATAWSPLESAADGRRRENPADARPARGARLPGEPPAAPRQPRPRRHLRDRSRIPSRSRSTRAACAACSPRAMRCSTSRSTAAGASP